MPGELEMLLERSKALGVRPNIGVRAKLAVKAGGHWTDSGGERSTFGLSPAQIVDVVDKLKACDMLDCFRLLHYHLGSQVSNIRDIRTGVMEGARLYEGLVQEGAPMGYLDLGGGLAVDYDGSHTNYVSSRNYSLDEYCADVVEAIMSILDEQHVPHPHIITESGRATVAYYSVLLFNILDVSVVEEVQLPDELPEDAPEPVRNLREVFPAFPCATSRNVTTTPFTTATRCASSFPPVGSPCASAPWPNVFSGPSSCASPRKKPNLKTCRAIWPTST